MPHDLVFTLVATFLSLTIIVVSAGSHFSMSTSTTGANCSIDTSVCTGLGRVCNVTSGQCQCPPELPIYLTSDIPCLKHRNLGELCLHTRECNSTPHAACIATFLVPIEITSIPSYKQWVFYNKINGDREINFLLDKMFGRCRCRESYRAVASSRCAYAANETPVPCKRSKECTAKVSHSKCDTTINRCRCLPGHFFEGQSEQCEHVAALHGQFCVSSSDCNVEHSHMECWNSVCRCASTHYFRNETGCVPLEMCPPGHVWNDTTLACSPLPMPNFSFCDLLIKLFPILLAQLVLFNLVRYLCRQRNQRHRHRSRPYHTPRTASRRNRDVDYMDPRHPRPNLQSYSLLSLPDYETILSDSYRSTAEERLPSYEEAVTSLQKISRNSEGAREENQVASVNLRITL